MPVAHEIIAHKVRPVLDAARQVGIAVFHLAANSYADRYPTYRQVAADPELKPPASVQDPAEGCVRPRTAEEVLREVLGDGFPGCVWETHRDIFDIARAARPLPDENVITDGWQLNGLCRRMDIDTLFYVGFMANICLLEVPGALREMWRKFGYRCVVLRDCTTAYEYPDTFEGMWMTRAAIRVVEQELGYSTSSAKFVEACEQARGACKAAGCHTEH
jgi:nicotinamidase-related amidase